MKPKREVRAEADATSVDCDRERPILIPIQMSVKVEGTFE